MENKQSYDLQKAIVFHFITFVSTLQLLFLFYTVLVLTVACCPRNVIPRRHHILFDQPSTSVLVLDKIPFKYNIN